MLSQSGETEEVVRLLPTLRDFEVPVIAITAGANNTLGRAASVVVELGKLDEAGSLGLAPSTSTTAMLALGDALALVTSRLRGFQPTDFARFHPGGSLGRKLAKVDEYMRPLAQCRIARDAMSVRQVVTTCTKPGRRTGAIMLIDAEGIMTGVFTDSDLARLFEQHREDALDGPIREVMTANPATVSDVAMLSEALELIEQRKISELPVIDQSGRPMGLIDITDLTGVSVEETLDGDEPEITVYPYPDAS